jgi:hypothetical protein
MASLKFFSQLAHLVVTTLSAMSPQSLFCLCLLLHLCEDLLQVLLKLPIVTIIFFGVRVLLTLGGLLLISGINWVDTAGLKDRDPATHPLTKFQYERKSSRVKKPERLLP